MKCSTWYARAVKMISSWQIGRIKLCRVMWDKLTSRKRLAAETWQRLMSWDDGFSGWVSWWLMCVACDCDEDGAMRQDCHQTTGRCVCKRAVTGDKCDRCLDPEHSFPRCISNVATSYSHNSIHANDITQSPNSNLSVSLSLSFSFFQ